jgi:hypothetical protein
MDKAACERLLTMLVAQPGNQMAPHIADVAQQIAEFNRREVEAKTVVHEYKTISRAKYSTTTLQLDDGTEVQNADLYAQIPNMVRAAFQADSKKRRRTGKENVWPLVYKKQNGMDGSLRVKIGKKASAAFLKEVGSGDGVVSQQQPPQVIIIASTAPNVVVAPPGTQEVVTSMVQNTEAQQASVTSLTKAATESLTAQIQTSTQEVQTKQQELANQLDAQKTQEVHLNDQHKKALEQVEQQKTARTRELEVSEQEIKMLEQKVQDAKEGITDLAGTLQRIADLRAQARAKPRNSTKAFKVLKSGQEPKLQVTAKKALHPKLEQRIKELGLTGEVEIREKKQQGEGGIQDMGSHNSGSRGPYVVVRISWALVHLWKLTRDQGLEWISRQNFHGNDEDIWDLIHELKVGAGKNGPDLVEAPADDTVGGHASQHRQGSLQLSHQNVCRAILSATDDQNNVCFTADALDLLRLYPENATAFVMLGSYQVKQGIQEADGARKHLILCGGDKGSDNGMVARKSVEIRQQEQFETDSGLFRMGNKDPFIRHAPSVSMLVAPTSSAGNSEYYGKARGVIREAECSGAFLQRMGSVVFHGAAASVFNDTNEFTTNGTPCRDHILRRYESSLFGDGSSLKLDTLDHDTPLERVFGRFWR